ncbi:MAG: M14 family metallopeptidase [candidate division KSB1 bacterium]|nr:M14 family metallopeptidase [candidate division KSB1 bacterium]MDZ7334180.1 M14 family metallopeptidase [candidate division KSB1 bacterium]MDZ7357313.1 M14 family metallopeptidase [candidate division KSB1 bacterium]MDZ7400873.1 M14 family metallopeptidase [candidate division KSB1 bacterium]
MKRRLNLVKLSLILMLAFLLSNSLCQNGNPGDPNAGLYHTYSELEAELQDLAKNHPAIAQLSSLGRSHEGRELWALNISDQVDNDESEPAIILLGAHHAREWISVEVPLLIARFLIEQYGVDTTVTRLVDQVEIWVVPMVNPDGHQHSVTTDRLWRKNRRNNGDGSFGVDLNRNYGYQWGGPGSSGDTFSEVYRGPAPFSEPETQAIRTFLEHQSPRALISYHSYSQLVLYPWGFTNQPAPDKALLDSLAVALAHQIRAVHGKNYVPGQSSTLYLASGDTTDWLYGLFGVPAFTIELRPDSYNPGFELPESEIRPTFEENLPAALSLINWAIQHQTTMAD